MFKSFALNFVGLIVAGIGGFLILFTFFEGIAYSFGEHEIIAIIIGILLFVAGRYFGYVSDHTVRVRK